MATLDEFNKLVFGYRYESFSNYEKSFLHKRVIDQIEYYDKSATRSKRTYYICKVLSYIIMAALTLTPLWDKILKGPCTILSGDNLPAILGAILFLVSGWMDVSKCQNKMVEHRHVCEILKKMTLEYLGSVSRFTDQDEALKDYYFKKFVRSFNDVILSECDDWRNYFTKSPTTNQ